MNKEAWLWMRASVSLMAAAAAALRLVAHNEPVDDTPDTPEADAAAS